MFCQHRRLEKRADRQKTYLLRMQPLFPLVREVMRILHDFHHEHLRVKHSVLFRDHSLCHGEYTCEYGDIKYDCPVWRDLKMEENVWIEDRSENKDRGE